jgi:SOS-response transcriptional repressor LexA
VGVVFKDTKELIIRQIYINNDVITLVPFNTKEFKPIETTRDKITIMGRVKRVIKEL